MYCEYVFKLCIFFFGDLDLLLYQLKFIWCYKIKFCIFMYFIKMKFERMKLLYLKCNMLNGIMLRKKI